MTHTIDDLRGVIAPATTPFNAAGNLNEIDVASNTEWLIHEGVHGIAAGGSTGEGHTLIAEEFCDLVAATVEAAQGRIPIVAGIITNSTRKAIRRGCLIRDMGVTALQVTPVHYLFKPNDQAMLDHFRALTEETGIPVIIYNVVPWTYLSPDLLLHIMEEVPGVIGVKQSAGDLKLLADLIARARSEDMIFSAVDALLMSSYQLGARGSIAAILSTALHANVDLWDAVQAGNVTRAAGLHVKLLALWNAMSHDNLPACTKYAQALQGGPSCFPRAPMPEPDREQRDAIREALASLGAID